MFINLIFFILLLFNSELTFSMNPKRQKLSPLQHPASLGHIVIWTLEKNGKIPTRPDGPIQIIGEFIPATAAVPQPTTTRVDTTCAAKVLYNNLFGKNSSAEFKDKQFATFSRKYGQSACSSLYWLVEGDPKTLVSPQPVYTITINLRTIFNHLYLIQGLHPDTYRAADGKTMLSHIIDRLPEPTSLGSLHEKHFSTYYQAKLLLEHGASTASLSDEQKRKYSHYRQAPITLK